MPKSPNQEHQPSGGRKALAAVSDALAEWREDVAESTETHTEKIADAMAEAARDLGWPDDIVDASKSHLKEMSKIQLEMLDRLIDAWQEQLKEPMPAHFVSSLQMPLSGAGLQGASAMAGLASKPVELWMQAALAWQRNMTSALSLWSGQAPQDSEHRGRSRSH